MREDRDRRRSPRYPVTISARISDARGVCRAEILDVSLGGLLLATPESFRAEIGARLEIDAAMIGAVRARVVATSAQGVHVRVDDEAGDYGAVVRKLSRLSRSW